MIYTNISLNKKKGKELDQIVYFESKNELSLIKFQKWNNENMKIKPES